MNKIVLKSNLIIAVIAILGITALINSCEKDVEFETNGIEKPLISEKVTDYSLDNIPMLKNQQSIEKLLHNPEDKDDEKINKYLYNLSLATRDFIRDANFNRIIIEMAKKSANGTANLLELEKKAPEYFLAINKKLEAKGMTIELISDDLTHRPVNPNPKFPETAEVEKYVPAIFIPNLENIDASKQPIISPNIEVDCRADESIEDNIVAWFFTEDGILNEIMISEETSLKTSNPLFLLDNASLDVKKNNVNILPPDESSKTTTSFSSYEYSIENGYDYESWFGGKSEFCVQAYRIDPDGEVYWIYNSSGWKEIAQVKDDNIGDLLYRWSHHASNWEPYSTNRVFWNTYERDWNRSDKNLGSATANGTTIYLVGRRKYTEEWYAWIPSTLQLHYSRFDWIYPNWAHWNNSWKSKFRLWRVEI